jgi:hypothetical protein
MSNAPFWAKYPRFFRARNAPFTTRSALLILFCSYLLIVPVPNSSDIIAASLAYGLLTILAALLLTTTAQFIVTKRALSSIQFYPPDNKLTSGEAATCAISTQHNIKLIPGLSLELKPLCSQSGIVLPTLKISKGLQAKAPLAFEISTPHRGNWEIHGLRCSVGDLTGLFKLNWQIPLETSIVAVPPPLTGSLLPLISSTQRAGDALNDTVHRLGDPFDIKPYHPSDGIKKIIWKAFAKSGQLLSRHPEPSMTPEGFVAIFVLARPEDDQICAKALNYIESLKELNLDLALCCEGQKGRAVGHDYESSRDLLVDSTWDATSSDERSIQADLQLLFDTCSAQGVALNLRKIGVFCSGSRLANPDDSSLIKAVISWFDERQIEPVFFLTDPKINIGEKASLREKVSSIFVESSRAPERASSRKLYESFLSTCVGKQWEVFV